MIEIRKIDNIEIYRRTMKCSTMKAERSSSYWWATKTRNKKVYPGGIKFNLSNQINTHISQQADG